MSFALSASTRKEKGEKIRSRTVIPAVVYGMGGQADSIALGYEEFAKLYREAGEASLIDLSIDGKQDGKVLIQDIAYDPVSDLMIHADLRRIDMNKPLTATVELRFVGEASVIKEQGGTLMHNLNSVQVTCLPKDLISRIDVDIAVLKTFDDLIKVKDLPIPANVTITSPQGDDLVAKAIPALTEEEIKAMEAAAPADLSKIETAGKKEEAEEGAEGESAAPAKKEEGKKE